MFVFRLEQVLQYKIKKEQNLEKELTLAKERYFKSKKLLDDLRDRLEVHLQEQCYETFPMIAHNSFYRELLVNKIQEQLKMVESTGCEVVKFRDLLLLARKERKILDILKEKKYQAYLKKVAEEEQKTVDEMARVAYLRNLS